jgi:hypothetical protein
MMSLKPGFLIPFAAAAALVPSLAAQGSKLTAREIYYTPQASAAHRPAAPSNAAAASKSRPAPERLNAEARTPARSNPQAAPLNLPGGASITMASAGPPLGLKYTIIKRSGSQVMEVPADTTFHARDGIQLKVETNVPGYLYIVNKGSSGTWKPMFPAPEIESGNNHVNGFQPVTLPSPDHQMTMDQQPGTENLFIVFSREPVPDFEELIYSLRDKSAPARPQSAPSRPQATPPRDRVVMARVDIDDATVGRLRRVYSRDLIIDKVTTDTPPDTTARKEDAVYVVNPNGSADARLVADLPLKHQ